MDQALLVLEREAKFKAENPSLPALFVFQFEALSRNRLGYTKGLAAMAADPFYTEDWQDYILTLRSRLGDVDFADLIFVRSEHFVSERTRLNPDFIPKFPVLFGEKEGKIARANRGRDPMYLFSALQRQLGYPEVPRPRRPDELEARVLLLEQKIAQLENRLKSAESDLQHDDVLTQVLVKPEDTAGVPAGWGKKSRSRRSRVLFEHRSDRHRRALMKHRTHPFSLRCLRPHRLLPAACRLLPGDRTVIDANFPGAYQVEVADVNGDKKPDIIAVGGDTCAWYENPTWKKRIVTTGKQTPGIISSATADLDGDGKAEIAIAYEFAMNRPTTGKLLMAVQGRGLDDPWKLVPIADIGQHPPAALGRRQRRQAARPGRRADLRPRGQAAEPTPARRGSGLLDGDDPSTRAGRARSLGPVRSSTPSRSSMPIATDSPTS